MTEIEACKEVLKCTKNLLISTSRCIKRICPEFMYLMAKWLSVRQPGVNQMVASNMLDEPNSIKSIIMIYYYYYYYLSSQAVAGVFQHPLFDQVSVGMLYKGILR
jgi:hypothetical protein